MPCERDRGGDPIPLGSLLSGLEDKQAFDAWCAMRELGMLDGYEVVYDPAIGAFRLSAPNEEFHESA